MAKKQWWQGSFCLALQDCGTTCGCNSSTNMLLPATVLIYCIIIITSGLWSVWEAMMILWLTRVCELLHCLKKS